MSKQLSLLAFFCLVNAFFHFSAFGQCANYSVYNVPPASLPDNCGNAINLASYYSNCQTICIDNTAATASSTVPNCVTSVAHDIWGSLQDAYSTIPGFDGSVVIAWKKYPSFPTNQPTLAAHAEIAGTLSIPFPLPVSINCGDGFLAADAVCTNYQDTNYDNTVVLPPGTFPTNAQIEQQIEDDPTLPVTSATVTSSKIWFQIETFDNVPGIICFEMSKQISGFTCGSPNIVTFSGAGTSQTQNVTACLCNSAANSGYFSTVNQPCTPPSNGGVNIGTTAYYQINAPYPCNQISVNVGSWAGTGSLNVAILSNLVCPTVPDSSTVPPTQRPGWVVSSANSLATGCLTSAAGNNTLATAAATCLPAGTYYVLISGNSDKDTFGAGITVSNNSPTGVVVQARAFLEGAYAGASTMSTTLRTNNYLPTAQPYNRVPWVYSGTESVANAAAIPTNTVDWVLLEARNATTDALIETRAAFLLSNGAIVDVDGISNGVRFQNLTSGSSYKLAVRHRNHLAVMGANSVIVPNATPYDFAATAQVVQGTSQLKSIGGIYVLHAGDTEAEGVICYRDYNIYAAQLSSSNTYLDSDCNLDGAINGTDFSMMHPNLKMCNVAQVRY